MNPKTLAVRFAVEVIMTVAATLIGDAIVKAIEAKRVEKAVEQLGSLFETRYYEFDE